MSQPKQNNRSLTYLGHDILYQICNLLSDRKRELHNDLELTGFPDLVPLSMTNKAMRRLSEPMLFENILILDNDEGGPEMWVMALKRLEMLNREGHGRGILRFVKTFDFTISSNYREPCGPPPSRIPSLLTSTLSHLPNLQTLTFSIPQSLDSAFEVFAQVLKTQSLLLPRVQKLVLSPCTEFFVPVCPDVRTVHMNALWGGTFDTKSVGGKLVEAVVKAGTVTELMFIGVWKIALVRALTSNPATSSLRSISIVTPNHEASIDDFIKALSPLTKLEELTIAGFSSLNMGYNPPKCGNSYMGRSGFELRKSMNRVKKEIEVQILGMVDGCFGVESALKKVVIGGRGESCFEKREVVGEGEGEGEKWWRVGRWVRERRSGDGEVEEVYVDRATRIRRRAKEAEKKINGEKVVVNEEVKN